MVNREEFAHLLYNTIISSTNSDQVAFEKLSPICNWIQKNIPSKLYRFRRYNEYTVNALKEDEIWGSSILEFNDPYECVPFYNMQSINDHINNVLQPQDVLTKLQYLKTGNIPEQLKKMCSPDILQQIIQSIPDVLDEGIIKDKLEQFEEGLKGVISGDFAQIIEKFYTDIRSAEAQRQIACFSEQNNSSLMWGHYADSHRGFCLQYDFREVLKKCSCNCHNIKGCNNFMLNFSVAPVIYSDIRFDATGYLSTLLQDYICRLGNIPMELYFDDTLIISKCLLTKSEDWKYENEWRLFSRAYQEQYKPYRMISHLKPKALFMGVMMDKEKELELYSICKDKGIKCYKMLQDFQGKQFTVYDVPYEQIINWTEMEKTNQLRTQGN
ncbi:MAG: DUF2971 domain-containing protein [Acetatifactor sp.]|nr:DUF2971 domain-containing protein [Acetatifactor sp.]